MQHESITIGIEWLALGPASVLKAQRRVVACQGCSPAVSRPFSAVLVEVFGAAGPTCQYVLCAPAECPNCTRSIVENTLVRSEGELHEDTSHAPGVFEECWDETNVMLVNALLLDEAQAYISGCEQCVGNAVGVPFDYILDALTESDPTTTEYVMCRPARCPRCFHEVSEKTRVVTCGDVV